MPRPPGSGFRSRKDPRQAIRLTANARFKVLTSGKLRLPKTADVQVRWSRPPPPQPSRVTVYLGQWRHVEEAARLPDAHACRSSGSARTTSALAMARRPRRTAAVCASLEQGQLHSVRRSLTNHDIPVREASIAYGVWRSVHN